MKKTPHELDLNLPYTYSKKRRGRPRTIRTGGAPCPFCRQLINMDLRCEHVVDVKPPSTLVLRGGMRAFATSCELLAGWA